MENNIIAEEKDSLKKIVGTLIKSLIGIQLIYFSIYTILGSFCTDYVIWAITGKNVSWVWDAIIGFLAGYIIIPISVLLKVLELAGIFVYPFHFGQ